MTSNWKNAFAHAGRIARDVRNITAHYRMGFSMRAAGIDPAEGQEAMLSFLGKVDALGSVVMNERSDAGTAFGYCILTIAADRRPQTYQSYVDMLRLVRHVVEEGNKTVSFDDALNRASLARIFDACDNVLNYADTMNPALLPILDRVTRPNA